jgi:hypothetical protein
MSASTAFRFCCVMRGVGRAARSRASGPAERASWQPAVPQLRWSSGWICSVKLATAGGGGRIGVRGVVVEAGAAALGAGGSGAVGFGDVAALRRMLAIIPW